MASGDATKGTRSGTYEGFFGSKKPTIWGPMTVSGGPFGDDTMWLTKPPCGHHGRLATFQNDPKKHVVVEEEDGQITVTGEDDETGSILCVECGWHGVLEEGVWKEL